MEKKRTPKKRGEKREGCWEEERNWGKSAKTKEEDVNKVGKGRKGRLGEGGRGDNGRMGGVESGPTRNPSGPPGRTVIAEGEKMEGSRAGVWQNGRLGRLGGHKDTVAWQATGWGGWVG